MAETRVSKGSNGQYKITIPKGIASSMGLEGERMEWKVKSASTLELSVTDE